MHLSLSLGSVCVLLVMTLHQARTNPSPAIVDVFRAAGKGGNTTDGAPVSHWGPALVVTRSNTTLLFAQADRNVTGPAGPTSSYIAVSRSKDGGLTWSDPSMVLGWGSPQVIYSRSTDTLMVLSSSNGSMVATRALGDVCSHNLTAYCGNTTKPVLAPSACEQCVDLHKPELTTAGCTGADLDDFCNLPPSPLPGVCTTVLTKSTDDGMSWSAATPLNVTNAWDPRLDNGHYTGVGLNHGVELRGSNYRGRLVAAHRYDCEPNNKLFNKRFARAYVLYSDNQGLSWTVGDLLPEGWTESAVAELRNGSLLLTARMAGAPYLTKHEPATDRRRGFARSDDGGETWAQTWFLEDRQPEVLTGHCSQALVSAVDDPNADWDSSNDVVFYGHPGSALQNALPRANYTLHRSTNGGASWEFQQVVYPQHNLSDGGAGYSDAQLLPGQVPRLGIAFQRTLYESHIEGGGYNMAFASVPVNLT